MEIRSSSAGLRSPFVQLALIALVTTSVSLYLVKDHIEDEDSSFCDVGAHISCTIVRRSVFSELMNVPVAVFGLLFNLVSLFAAAAGSKAGRGERYYRTALFFWNAFGTVFVFYLILAELYLKALCPMCTVLHVLQVVAMYIAWKAYSSARNNPSLVDTLIELRYWVLIIGALNFAALVFFNTAGSGLSTIGEQESISDSDFARCITREGWRFYGRTGCSWCAKQKLLFGSTVSNIIFIDCAMEDMASECAEKKLEAFPTWIKFNDEGEELERWLGYASVKTFELLTPCRLPEEAEE